MRKIGKKTQEWITARTRLKKLYEKKGIRSCELKFANCTRSYGLTFAHLYKRSDPRCRHTYAQTVYACLNCHLCLEQDPDLTERMFKELRPT